jgi:hypothetical protein
VRGKLAFFTFLVVLWSGAVSAQTYEFSTCGASGRYGPSQSQCDSAYSGTNLEGEVNVVGEGIQEWTVPEDGNYRIKAAGATMDRQYADYRGGGAIIRGNFVLEQGTQLNILVGQEGITGGGGGGTFVATGTGYSTSSPLIVAGGAAQGHTSNDKDEIYANTATWGHDSGGGVNGGDNGNGGNDADGTGGGGFYGDGGGQAFQNGGVGDLNGESIGGFGGGGHGESGGDEGGGGGGYSGGASTNDGDGEAAGGGGSFIDSSATSANTSDGSFTDSSTADEGYDGPVGDLNQYNFDDGYVEIELIEAKGFCNYRGSFNECIMNETNQLKNQQYNVSSVFKARENAVFEAFSGRATLNITNSTSLSGLWRGEFFIQTEDPRIKPGAEFRPENGDIVVGE